MATLCLVTPAPSGADRVARTTAGTALVHLSGDLRARELTDVGGTLFFRVDGAAHDGELWTSDGSPAGTVLVADVGGAVGDLTAIGERLYFTADDGAHGRELWTSDGTAAGTSLVLDISTGAAGAFDPGTSPGLTEVDGTVYFAADDGVHGRELWRTDGTAEGTALVRDILPGTDGSAPGELADMDGTLLLSADDGDHGRELWRSDGTVGGTVLVKNIADDTYYVASSDVRELTDVGGTLFFSADGGDGLGRELWRSDGTEAGTVLVKDIQPATYHGYWYSSEPSELTVVGDGLYFSAFTEGHGTELWRSDGTPAGTVLVEDIRPGASDDGSVPRSATPHELVALGSALYFVANDGVDGWELWTSDGSTAGTRQVTEVEPGPSPVDDPVRDLTPVGDLLYFVAREGPRGAELWTSDGTSAGTRLFVDLAPGRASSATTSLTASGASLSFTGRAGLRGRSLWRTVSGPHGPTCHDIVATITGSGRVDGTPGDDVILGSPSPDTIAGRGGDDIVCGAGGDDRLVGGSGGDVLLGRRGADHLVLRDGTVRNDVGDGGRGADVVVKDRGDREVGGG